MLVEGNFARTKEGTQRDDTPLHGFLGRVCGAAGIRPIDWGGTCHVYSTKWMDHRKTRETGRRIQIKIQATVSPLHIETGLLHGRALLSTGTSTQPGRDRLWDGSDQAGKRVANQ